MGTGVAGALRRLAGLDRAEKSPAASPPANPYVRSHGPATAASGSPPPAVTARGSDIEVGKPAGSFGAGAGKWGLRLLVWLVVVAGVWSVFVRPFIGGSTSSSAGAGTAPAGVDVSAAQGAAVRFATDYLTWSPTSTASRARALTADTQSGTDATTLAFSGSTVMTALTAVPGHVQVYGLGSAAVTVDVRVSFAKAGSKGAAAAVAAEATALGTATASAAVPALPGQPAVPAPTMPEGYEPQGVAWLRLAVPVVAQGGQLVVGSAGPVLLDDPLSTGLVGGEGTDGAQTDATQSWAGQFMKAYAASAAAYQAAPGVTLAGLGQTVGLAKVNSWTLSNPDDKGVRAGTVGVLWTLGGTDLAVPQVYSLAVTQDAGRWYVRSLGPAMSAPSQ